MTITRVQSTWNCLGNSSSLPLALSNYPTEGNVLIAVIGTYGSYPPAVNSISHTSGNVTWARQTGNSTWSLYGRNVEIWAGVVHGSVSRELTIYLRSTGSGANADPVIADICEYSGLSNTDLLDQVSNPPSTGVYTRTLQTGYTNNTTIANELWVGGVFNVCDAGNGNSD